MLAELRCPAPRRGREGAGDGGNRATRRAGIVSGAAVNMVANTCQCEWCGRTIIARNRNGVEKRYCGRPCKGAFQTAAVRYTRLLLGSGGISVADLKAALQTTADSADAGSLHDKDQVAQA